MKIKHKEGLFFGITMTIFFIIKTAWSEPVLTAAIIAKSVFAGVVGGIVAGLAYGFIWHRLKPKISKQGNQPK
jgi:vacuolar-type H+-ATPase subunit I/STV1